MRWLTMLIIFGGWGSLIATAEADVVRLKNGGELRGSVKKLEKDAPKGLVVVETLTGGVVTVAQTDVEYVTHRPPKVEEYMTLTKEIPNTVEGHWELAEWCKAQGLKDQRTEQLEELVEIESDHTAAHKILGHVRFKGVWMTKDEEMAEKGYVKHKGKYVTQQELDLMLKTSAEREAESGWNPKIRLWLGWWLGNNVKRSEEGLAQLKTLRDPDAIVSLQRHLGTHADPEVRHLFVQILAKIPSKKTVHPLVDRLLLDDAAPVWNLALEQLKNQPEELRGEAVAWLIPALKHARNRVVLRAAVGLAEVGSEQHAPYLIDALVTVHREKIELVDNSKAVTFTNPNGNAPSPNPYLAMPGAVIQEPNLAIPRTQVITLKVAHKNDQVLEALMKLTGLNFGFDQTAWQAWWLNRTARPGK